MIDLILLKYPITISGNSFPSKIRFFIIPLLIFVLSLDSPAAVNSEPTIIDTVIIKGNRVTKDFVILSEMSLKVGVEATDEAIAWDKGRLESLRLFTRATLELEKINGLNALVVDVTELWYIWPGLIFDLDENNPERYAYGVILSHDNFRGRRDLLSINARIGYVTGFQLDWKIPYITMNRPDLSISFRAKMITENEPRYILGRDDVKTEEKSFQLRFSKRMDLEKSVWVSYKIIERVFKHEDDDNLLIPSLREASTIMSGSLGFTFDTRSYRPWPDDGFNMSISVGGGVDVNDPKTSFFSPVVELSTFYSPIREFYLVGYVEGSLLAGSLPPFQRLLLDGDNGLRSSVPESFSGTRRLNGTFEIRKDLIPITYITMRSLPFVQPYTKDIKTGLSLSIFSDAGIIGGDPSEDAVVTGEDRWEVAYGLGLVIHVPYRDLIRLEVARSARYPSEGILLRARIGTSF